jgi:hypothetical protein
MDDSQANNDILTERLKNAAQQHVQGQQAKIDQQSSQQRANTFVSDHASKEYDNLIRLLKELAEEMSCKIGNLPKFVASGCCIQLGNRALYYQFDQPIANRLDINELVLSVGTVPNKMSVAMFGPHRHLSHTNYTQQRPKTSVASCGSVKTDNSEAPSSLILCSNSSRTTTLGTSRTSETSASPARPRLV